MLSTKIDEVLQAENKYNEIVASGKKKAEIIVSTANQYADDLVARTVDAANDQMTEMIQTTIVKQKIYEKTEWDKYQFEAVKLLETARKNKEALVDSTIELLLKDYN